MIGKSERGPVAIKATGDNQSAYLMAVGGAATWSPRRSSRPRWWVADLGMGSDHEFEVQDMPVTVAVDSTAPTCTRAVRPSEAAHRQRRVQGHRVTSADACRRPLRVPNKSPVGCRQGLFFISWPDSSLR